MIQEGKAVFWRYKFHKAECKGRTTYYSTCTSVGEAVDVTCTEHNHPPDQTSKKLVSSVRKGPCNLTVIIKMPWK